MGPVLDSPKSEASQLNVKMYNRVGLNNPRAEFQIGGQGSCRPANVSVHAYPAFPLNSKVEIYLLEISLKCQDEWQTRSQENFFPVFSPSVDGAHLFSH